MEEFVDKLKQERGEDTIRERIIREVVYIDRPSDPFNEKKLKKGKSMIDLGDRDKEADDRRVHTDPHNSKDNYDSHPPNFDLERNDLKRKKASKLTSDKGLGGSEEYERRQKKNLAEERKDSRTYGGHNPMDED